MRIMIKNLTNCILKLTKLVDHDEQTVSSYTVRLIVFRHRMWIQLTYLANLPEASYVKI